MLLALVNITGTLVQEFSLMVFTFHSKILPTQEKLNFLFEHRIKQSANSFQRFFQLCQNYQRKQF